jgi:hypothetical protein
MEKELEEGADKSTSSPPPIGNIGYQRYRRSSLSQARHLGIDPLYL